MESPSAEANWFDSAVCSKRCKGCPSALRVRSAALSAANSQLEPEAPCRVKVREARVCVRALRVVLCARVRACVSASITPCTHSA